MKKALSIGLILLAIIHIAGVSPYYFFLLQEIKGEVALELGDNSQLQKLTITFEDYNDPAVFQKTDDNEFRFHGQMYDYRSVTPASTGYVFTVLADAKENQLGDLLNSAFQQSNDKNKTDKSPLNNLKSFFKDFVSTPAREFSCAIPQQNAYSSAFTGMKPVSGFHLVVQCPPDLAGA